ncbi:hypothetical protein BD770DRAFT_429776 [Pilaira anomala]|nr:hypothetical protein BD770DRAFT_429776 [Pilaira anomala]
MDFIKLERVEPLQSSSSIVPMPRPTTNQPVPFSAANYQGGITGLNSQFNKLRTKTLSRYLSRPNNVKLPLTKASHFEKIMFLIKLLTRINKNPMYKLITKGELDAIFIYDSACKVNVDKEMSLLKGIGGNETPLLFYIACMDTIEMRIHTFNRCAPVSVDWNTKVSNLSYKLQQVLLLQPNRQPDQTAVTSWNDRLLQTIFHRLYLIPVSGCNLTALFTMLDHHSSASEAVFTLPRNNNASVNGAESKKRQREEDFDVEDDKHKTKKTSKVSFYRSGRTIRICQDKFIGET